MARPPIADVERLLDAAREIKKEGGTITAMEVRRRVGGGHLARIRVLLREHGLMPATAEIEGDPDLDEAGEAGGDGGPDFQSGEAGSEAPASDQARALASLIEGQVSLVRMAYENQVQDLKVAHERELAAHRERILELKQGVDDVRLESQRVSIQGEQRISVERERGEEALARQVRHTRQVMFLSIPLAALIAAGGVFLWSGHQRAVTMSLVEQQHAERLAAAERLADLRLREAAAERSKMIDLLAGRGAASAGETQP